MWTYLGAFVVALIVAAIMTPIVARLAHRVHAIDVPGEARKIHTRAIPRIGGVAVVTAFFAPIIGLAIYTNRISGLMYADSRLVLALIAGASVIVALGVYDDIRGADAKTKLAVQSVVAVGMWMAGFRIDLLGNPLGIPFQLGMFSLPLTWLWLVGVSNAMNLIDGLDGLASGVALFAAMVLFGVSFIDNAVLLCVMMAALGGALVGFLFFNFNPAKIFLGDSGSLFLGFILGAVSIWTQRKGATAVALLIPIIALGVPILDTTLSVVRRLSKGQHPFTADREHVHHRLLALGLTHRGAVYTLYTVSAVFALGALALLDNDTTRRAIALSTVTAVVFILVRRVGVFSTPLVMKPAVAPSTDLRDVAREAARRIRAARDDAEAWGELIAVANRLGCEELRLAWRQSDRDAEDADKHEVVFHWRATGGSEWRLEGPLGPYDTATRMTLEEHGKHYGDLTALRARPPVPSPDSARQDVALEMFRDALIDFRVGVTEREQAGLHEGRVVALPARGRDLSRHN